MSNVRCSLTETSCRADKALDAVVVPGWCCTAGAGPCTCRTSSFMQAMSSYGWLKFLVVHPPGVTLLLPRSYSEGHDAHEHGLNEEISPELPSGIAVVAHCRAAANERQGTVAVPA